MCELNYYSFSTYSNLSKLVHLPLLIARYTPYRNFSYIYTYKTTFYVDVDLLTQGYT